MKRVLMCAAAGVVGFSALAGSGVTAPATVRADTPLPVNQRCKKPGVRLVGKTKQGGTICLTFSANARQLLEFGFAFKTSCSPKFGAVYFATGTNPKVAPLPVAADGRFDVRNPNALYFLQAGGGTVMGSTNAENTLVRGKVSRTTWTAAGTLREHPSLEAVSDETCDSGLLSWTARKAAA